MMGERLAIFLGMLYILVFLICTYYFDMSVKKINNEGTFKMAEE